ncbi:hypothetical protein IQ06DRAFT_59059 [Phaeosphaeriaceae sp. SRC1lsM3a]|nr:hypothetical protein IQ06DRAFT_59059 [Stagonospora sp. SRC1lsM3a]
MRSISDFSLFLEQHVRRLSYVCSKHVTLRTTSCHAGAMHLQPRRLSLPLAVLFCIALTHLATEVNLYCFSLKNPTTRIYRFYTNTCYVNRVKIIPSSCPRMVLE